MAAGNVGSSVILCVRLRTLLVPHYDGRRPLQKSRCLSQ
jgi:hypothetical protein